MCLLSDMQPVSTNMIPVPNHWAAVLLSCREEMRPEVQVIACKKDCNLLL